MLARNGDYLEKIVQADVFQSWFEAIVPVGNDRETDILFLQSFEGRKHVVINAPCVVRRKRIVKRSEKSVADFGNSVERMAHQIEPPFARIIEFAATPPGVDELPRDPLRVGAESNMRGSNAGVNVAH